jgi:flavin-binding protein dodecin
MSQPVGKVIEIIGSSERGWETAAQVAVDEAETIQGIHGLEAVDMTTTIDPNSGKITN